MYSGGLRGDKWVDLQDKALVRLKTHGKRFEILVNPISAFKIKQNPSKFLEALEKAKIGEEIPSDIKQEVLDALELDQVFRNVSKGERVEIEVLEEIFQTKDEFIVALHIMLKGDLQLTQEQREQLFAKKRKAIVDFIARHSFDPKNNTPHTPTRIENAIKQCKIHIDPSKSVEQQARDIVKEIRSILPIRLEQVKMAIRVPGDVAAKTYSVVKRFASVQKEEWHNDGTWIGLVTLAAGMQLDFMDKVGNSSKGRAEIKILSRERM
ncbi:MAG: ribosome assembly factor SBDS [Candidatus Hodarchaeota archaeon]